MIGVEDEFEKIRDALICNHHEREVISVVGTGGAGKTTLAQKVYCDPSVLSHFEIRAWITVSQEFSVRKLLIGIIGCIVSLTNEISKADDTEYLADRLCNILKGQRYLIVLDDIWTTEVWDHLQTGFPNNLNGNRILITTRTMEVAQHASRSNSSNEDIYNIRFLTSEESWNLFVKKLMFNGEAAFPSPELESIGKKIVEKCRGLPLPIVVIAGLLATLERSPQKWEDFARNINSISTTGMESHSVLELLALSYNNLPSHLRACFLYLGIFPQGSVICVKKLIKLWMAEGFLMPKKGKSLEEVAQDSLNALITRSILLVQKRSFDGKVKLCRIHDLLHDFCLKKVQEDNTLVVSNEYCDKLPGMEPSQLGCRWMSCQSHLWPFTKSSSSSKIRSILHFGKDLFLAKCMFIFPRLKLLRVLDLSLIKYWNGMPSEIVNLIHLRYLALTTAGSLYNFQLCKLKYLQTLILFSWMEECQLQLPCDILNLPWLRHVRFDKGSSLYLPNMSQSNLQTLFWLKVACWDAKTPDFTMVPNLTELGIYIEGEMSANTLDNLTQLCQLESLKFEMGRVKQFCLPLSFPPSIKKLTLRNTYLSWEKMDIIGRLPNLEVLKLKDFAFCGPKWEARDVCFYRLKCLLIVHLDLKQWNASSNKFPVLECLVLRSCSYLKELPSDIACISGLRLIELIDCCPSLVKSAMRIQEEMFNNENDGLVVRHSSTEPHYFDILAWTVASHQHNVKQILTRLLGCFVSMTSEIYEKHYEELADLLCRFLSGQRYLIVVDDIWNTRVWDDIKVCFPHFENGSRILMTTREREVAAYATSSDKFIYHMSFLNPVESWELFASKVYKGGPRPLELELIGRKIVEKCSGLPLAIIMIAELLLQLHMSPQSWEDFAHNINSSLMAMEPYNHTVTSIFALSYNNLPVHLQACFLYLGIFPKHSDIHVKKLIKLWVAEGFLEPRMHKSLEEVAQNYLYDLIAKSLVLVVKRSFDGKVKSCRLHGLVHDFCLRKAQEENMVVVSSEYCDDLAGTWSDTKQSKLGCRWMSCQSRRWPFTRSSSLNYTQGKIHSILYFGKDLYLTKCRFIFPCLQMLKVLDLSSIKYSNGMPSEIVNLIHLRYLALTTIGSLYHFQWFKLQSLQTLILFSWKEEFHLQLPCDILDLPRLRHVHLDKGSSLYLPSSIQENLQTLLWLKVDSWDIKTSDFTMVPNVKELGIYIEGEVWRAAFYSLIQLHQLENLKFEARGVERFDLPISFPPSIKKLIFSKTYLPWEKLDVIGKLPNLEVLKLKDFGFCGSKWEPWEEDFQALKLLLIAHSDLKHWNVSYDHFPVLEHLVLKYCWDLVNIPIEFADNGRLKSIELESCYSSLAMSAQKIKDQSYDFGIDLLVRELGIKDKLSEEESESSEEENE